jgi:hypothetical protein
MTRAISGPLWGSSFPQLPEPYMGGAQVAYCVGFKQTPKAVTIPQPGAVAFPIVTCEGRLRSQVIEQTLP